MSKNLITIICKLLLIGVYLLGFTDLSLNDQMRLLQSTWAELLTLTMAFRSLDQLGDQKSDKKKDVNDVSSIKKESLKLRFASDYWLDEQLARECCGPLSSNGTALSATSSTINCTVSTPTVLDIYNLVSTKITQNKKKCFVFCKFMNYD